MSKVQIKIPEKIGEIFFEPRGEQRFRVAHGGRGSGKSFSFAKMAAVFGAQEKLRILCTREFQNSIKESFHAELKNAIESEDYLKSQYNVGVDYIRGKNGTEFIFRGLARNIDSVKSLAQIDICIVEEAETVPEASWRALLPTIRAPKSEIWVIYNPANKESSTNKMFRINEPPPRSVIREINWRDNPWFPVELEEQRLHAEKVMDHATYAHVWEGAYLELTESQVFRDKYRVEDFEPDHSFGDPLHGLDFGFAKDPTVAVQLYAKENTLYIYKEAGQVGLELDHTAGFISSRIPNISKWPVRADSARPESISYLSRHGIPFMVGVKKWAGSVEDGISYMKSFDEIVIHSSCTNTLKEFKLYSYKVDKRTGDILPVIIDLYNHYIDAIRYALAPMIQNKFRNYKGLA